MTSKTGYVPTAHCGERRSNETGVRNSARRQASGRGEDGDTGSCPLAAAAAVLGVVVGTGATLKTLQSDQPSAGYATHRQTGPSSVTSSPRIPVVTAPGYPSQSSLPARVEVGSQRVDTALHCGSKGQADAILDSRGWPTVEQAAHGLLTTPGGHSVAVVLLSREDAVALVFREDGSLSARATMHLSRGKWFPQVITFCAK